MINLQESFLRVCEGGGRGGRGRRGSGSYRLSHFDFLITVEMNGREGGVGGGGGDYGGDHVGGDGGSGVG